MLKIGQKPHFWWFFPLFFKRAGWELLKIASHVDFSVPVHLARSDSMHNFYETFSENPCGVRLPPSAEVLSFKSGIYFDECVFRLLSAVAVTHFLC